MHMPHYAPPGSLAAKVLTLLGQATAAELAEFEAAVWKAATDLDRMRAALRMFASAAAVEEADLPAPARPSLPGPVREVQPPPEAPASKPPDGRSRARRGSSMAAVIGVLSEGPLPTMQLVRACGLSQPTVSLILRKYPDCFAKGPTGWRLTAVGIDRFCEGRT